MRRAIVVGGSLGGLFAGCNLLRSGWDVVVVERTAGPLSGRGAGLGVHAPMLEGLLAAGARVDSSVGVALGGRAVLARDGTVAAEISMPQFCTSWARLYALLSDAFPEERVRRGVAVTRFDQDNHEVAVHLSDGTMIGGDVLVGADGVRSTVRRQLLAGADLAYAGYVAWRGMVEESALSTSAHAALFHRFAWGLTPREHILGYPVPGEGDDVTPGQRRYNFVWYRPVDSAQQLIDMMTDVDGRYHPDGIAPQAIRPALVDALRNDADRLLCAAWAEMVCKAEQPLFQQIGDLESPSMAYGRVALLGDAAFVARPHAARGAIKAGHDGMTLAAALESSSVPDGLQKYDAIRRPANKRVVAESRRLGAYLEGKGERTSDLAAFLRENGGVEPSMADGGLFVQLLATAGFSTQ